MLTEMCSMNGTRAMGVVGGRPQLFSGKFCILPHGPSTEYHMYSCTNSSTEAQSQEFFSKSISPGFDNAGISAWQRRINQNAACPRVRSTAISQPFRICLKRESLIRSNRYSVLIFELSEQIGLKTRQADLRNNPADDGGAKPQDHSR